MNLIEPLAIHVVLAKKRQESAIDLLYAYTHALLDEKAIRLTSFSSGDKLYVFLQFFDIKVLPIFFTKQRVTFFQKLIDRSFA